MNRNGEGEKDPLYDPGSDGREGESSARIIYGMEQKLIQHGNSFSDKLHQQVIAAVQLGYRIQDHPVTSLGRCSWLALICCGQYIAVSLPGQGDFDRSYAPNLFVFDALVTTCDCVDSC